LRQCIKYARSGVQTPATTKKKKKKKKRRTFNIIEIILKKRTVLKPYFLRKTPILFSSFLKKTNFFKEKAMLNYKVIFFKKIK